MRRIAACILLLSLSPSLATATIPRSSKRKLELPIEEWLKEPPREDFPVRLRIPEPRLTFEQRQLVRVFGRIDVRLLQRNHIHRELHFIVKVQDATGKWDEEESYATTSFAEEIKTAADIELVTDIYLSAGEYTVAVIAYDAVLKERSVARERVQVPAIYDDPLPRLDEDLPPVEFLPEAQAGTVPLGDEHRTLPLRSDTAWLIDLIIDFGNSKLHTGSLLQAASLLSRISPRRGCVVVSGLDVLRLEILFRRSHAADIKWPELRKQLLERNISSIDASQLAARQRSAIAFGEFLGGVMAEPPVCDVEPSAAKRMIIILSDGVEFPRGTPLKAVESQHNCACAVYYLRQMQWHRSDDLPRLLKRLHSQTKDIYDPWQFRKRLAELIAHLDAVASEAKRTKLDPN